MRRLVWAMALAAACGGASQSKLRQVGGVLDVQPATLDFGDVALGREATLAATVQNDGIVPLAVTELTPLHDPAFEVSGLPLTLLPGEKAAVSVRYRPPQLGTHTQSVHLVTDAPGGAAAGVGLRGHAVRGLATLSGDSFDFGDVVVNEVASQTLSLNNNDGHAITSIRIEQPAGGESAAFTVKPPGDSALAPEQSLLVTIDFRPTHLGEFSAVVPVTPCPTCSARNVALSGRGVTRLLLVEPADIDFGLVLLGATATRPVSVRNTSKGPLVVQGLAITGAADFDVALDNLTYPSTLAPGQTVSGVARFHPRALGAEQAQAALSASDGAPGVLALHGTGYGPVLQATPRSIYLGPTALGTRRPARLRLTNVGLDPQSSAPLRVSRMSLESQDPAFRLDTAAPIDVGEPGAGVTVQVSFAPTREGVSQATLVIDSNDGLAPQIRVPVAASGRALLPCTLASTPPNFAYDFGPTPVGRSTVQGFELTNTTSPPDDCIIGEPTLTGPAVFRWPGGVVPGGRTLPPGGRMSVRLEFAPDAPAQYSGAVSFYVSNPATNPVTVALSGSGDDLGCFYLSPATVDFGATTLGCGVRTMNTYAVNHCNHWVKVLALSTSGDPFSVTTRAPFDAAPQSSTPIAVSYAPSSTGDDVGMLSVLSSEHPTVAYQAGLTGGAQTSGTVLDQWDQSTPKVDLLIVIDNSGSMQDEQQALASNLDHLWNRIAQANADFHIGVTTTGMEPYTSGFAQCPGGAFGGEGGRLFPVDNSRPRLLTPQTPDVKNVLFQNTNVGLCHWKEQFTEPVVAALTDPVVNTSNAGFLRDDARLALLAVSDTDDDVDLATPPPVSYLVDTLRKVKHGALDLVSFSAIVPLTACSTIEAVGTRYQEIARQLHGQVFDICRLDSMGAMLESAVGNLMQPLSSFPLSAHPRDPAAIEVTVDGVMVSNWSYDAVANRIVFPSSAIPPPGSHITAKYQPACG